MKKILFIRFSSIGDIVLTTPVVRCLKNQLGAEIHFLTKRPYLPLLEANPYLSKVITIEKKIGEALQDLKSEQYDVVIDLHKNLRSYRLRTALRTKTFSFDKLNIEKWLLVNFKADRLPNIHIVNRYFKAVDNLGVSDDGAGLDYFFPPGFDKNKQSGISSLKEPYLVFAIGAAHQTKRLPTGKIIEICEKLETNVCLIGGKAEEAEGAAIAKTVGKKVTNYCGRLTLHESAKLILNAKKVIAHDSGMMHIAAAFQKEIISVWGSTVPAFGMYPYYGNQPDKNTTIEIKGLPCRPCSKIGFGKCPKGHFRCMVSQDAKSIAQAVNNE